MQNRIMENVNTNEQSVDNYIQNFFDEMNILRTEKKKRVETAKTFQRLLKIFFVDFRGDILDGRFLHEKLDNDYIDDIITVYMNVVEDTNKDIQYDSDVMQRAIQSANHIYNTTKDAILGNANDITFTNNVMLGVGMSETQFPGRLEYYFDPNGYRVADISINESLWVNNYTRHKKKVEQGQLTHTWETMKDEAVRGAHVAADGQTVPINEPFLVGGYKMMFPGDTLTSNPPGELTINCRCIEL